MYMYMYMYAHGLFRVGQGPYIEILHYIALTHV